MCNLRELHLFDTYKCDLDLMEFEWSHLGKLRQFTLVESDVYVGPLLQFIKGYDFKTLRITRPMIKPNQMALCFDANKSLAKWLTHLAIGQCLDQLGRPVIFVEMLRVIVEWLPNLTKLELLDNRDVSVCLTHTQTCLSFQTIL